MKAASLVLVLTLVACTKENPPVPTTPTVEASAPSSTVATSTPTPTPAQSAVTGPSPRNARANELLSKCQIAAPAGTCKTDADCVEVAITDNECCPSTLHIGVSVAAAKTFSAACKAPGCPGPRPSCVVHWNFAETGEQTAANRAIGVHCTSGTCLTSYGPSQ